VIILIFLIIIVFVFPEFIPRQKTRFEPEASANIRKRIMELKLNDTGVTVSDVNESDKTNDQPLTSEAEKGVLFAFDPNTLPEDGWKKLGIGERTIRTIKNYIGKGGKFRRPEDLQKIYGIRKNQYEKLLPFIKINLPEEQLQPQHERKLRVFRQAGAGELTIIDLNRADTSALILLPGIGSKLANRILNFRTKLGGFYSIEQVKEVYGLPDSTYQKIRPLLTCDTLLIDQINVNTVDLAELRNHPYIKWNIANAIINYRLQHGEYGSLEDLLKIQIITPDVFARLIPYLRLN
jgi:DNA uptake protein ComE-like DNA-binding protein